MDDKFKSEPLTSESCESGYGSEIGSLSLGSEDYEYCNYMTKAYTPDSDGDTYLHILPTKGEYGLMNTLIELCPDSKYLDIQNRFDQTALHLAAYFDLSEQIGLLILKNASLDLMDIKGNNFIHLIAEKGHVKSLQKIIEVSQQFGRMGVLSRLLEEKNHEGFTPFFTAVIYQSKDVCYWLKNHFRDLDVNSLDLKNGNSPLHEAVMMKDKANDMVTFLLRECLLDVNVQNKQGITPLHMASCIGNEELCRTLLTFYARVDLKDVDEKISLNYAKNERIFQLLSSVTS